MRRKTLEQVVRRYKYLRKRPRGEPQEEAMRRCASGADCEEMYLRGPRITEADTPQYSPYF